jgi:hypothetical protein
MHLWKDAGSRRNGNCALTRAEEGREKKVEGGTLFEKSGSCRRLGVFFGSIDPC